MPFSLPSPFSITRFNFFCLQVLLTRASLLALAKSIYYYSSALGCQVKGNKDIRQIEYTYVNIFDEMANNEWREFAFSFFFISSIFLFQIIRFHC